jgi:molybdenum cofactor guanylyltransferase
MKTSLILIGGNASRAGGYPKYLFRIGEKSFLDRQIEILLKCTDEIYVVSRDEAQIQSLQNYQGVCHICDLNKGLGPSGGIQAGILYMNGDYFFVTACDMPLISCEVVSYLFDQAKGYDAAVPIWDDGNIEPLCAVYRKTAVLNYYNRSNNKRLASLVSGINTKMIPVEELKKFDPELQIFTNINDIQSYEELKKIIAD